MVAFATLHESVVVAFSLTFEGVAVKDAKLGSGITLTVILEVAVPPIPVHERLNVVVVASAPVETELLVA